MELEITPPMPSLALGVVLLAAISAAGRVLSERRPDCDRHPGAVQHGVHEPGERQLHLDRGGRRQSECADHQRRTHLHGRRQPAADGFDHHALDNSKWHAPAGFTFQTQAAAPETNDTLRVEFYANGTLLGTRTSAPYSFNVANLTAGSYTLTAKAIDGQSLETTSAARTIVVSDTNNPPTVGITAPTANANFPTPASQITVNATANAGEVNGWVTRVEFYVNGALTHTDTAGPFSFNWTSVPPGSYALTAKAVDQLNGETVSAPVNVTVGATPSAIYFIHTDQLNSPRVITNGAGQAVWTWANDDPFGYNAPNENPSGQGNFTCNLRFPGQYFDAETNLHYNGARDYDSSIGRYIQPEPLGLAGDINLYRYARTNPLTYFDPDGAQAIPMPGPFPPFGAPSPGNAPSRPGDDFFNDQPRPARPSIPIPGWLTDLFAAKIYTCNMRCNVQQIDPCVQCPDRVTGTGTGKTKEAACKAAQKNANSKVPRGCYARHCHEY